jgi:hypothetical protein
MKKKKRYKHKKKSVPTVKELTEILEQGVKLDITIMPDNKSIIYKDYTIMPLDNENWGLYDNYSKDLIDQFHLRSSALLAARAYFRTNLQKYTEIKTIDRKFWATQLDMLICKSQLKQAKEFDRYLILLNKLEHCQHKNSIYKAEISKMFRWAFV